MDKLRIGIASDHRGFPLKEKLIKHFEKEKDIIIKDYGTNSIESTDYPDYAYKLGTAINNNDIEFGIAICGSGIGISIALNKMQGIYCAKVSNREEARYTRIDNNTNCVAFGELTDLEEAIAIVDTFIHTKYSNLDKHNRRLDKVKEMEKHLYD